MPRVPTADVTRNPLDSILALSSQLALVLDRPLQFLLGGSSALCPPIHTLWKRDQRAIQYSSFQPASQCYPFGVPLSFRASVSGLGYTPFGCHSPLDSLILRWSGPPGRGFSLLVLLCPSDLGVGKLQGV